MNIEIVNYNFINKPILSPNGINRGLLHKQTIDVNGEQVETGYQYLITVSNPNLQTLDLSAEMNLRFWHRFSIEDQFVLTAQLDKFTPTYGGGKPAINGAKILVNDNFFCNNLGQEVSAEIAGLFDEQGEPILDERGYHKAKSGYFQMGTFFFIALIRDNIVMSTLNTIKSRYENQD